jgi:iron complex transport system substrate-binding protein
MRNSKILSFYLILATMFLVFLVGCAGGTPTAPSDTAAAPTVKPIPKRIISLSPANTEIIYALGAEDHLVGRTDYCDYPPQVKDIPSIGGYSNPDIEQVISRSPDLVLADSIHEKEVVPALKARGLNVIVVAPESIAQVILAIKLVGDMTGKEKEALALTGDMQRRIKAVTDKTMLLSNRPSTCFIVWHDPLMIAGSGTFQDELIERAGGTNIGHKLTGYGQDYSLENLIMDNPQIIITGVSMGTGETLQFVQSEPRLKDIAARRDNRVYPIDQDIATLPGPRIVDALEEFAKDIHPEVFK